MSGTMGQWDEHYKLVKEIRRQGNWLNVKLYQNELLLIFFINHAINRKTHGNNKTYDSWLVCLIINNLSFLWKYLMEYLYYFLI